MKGVSPFKTRNEKTTNAVRVLKPPKKKKPTPPTQPQPHPWEISNKKTDKKNAAGGFHVHLARRGESRGKEKKRMVWSIALWHESLHCRIRLKRREGKDGKTIWVSQRAQQDGLRGPEED